MAQKPDPMQMAAELELEMMSDMYQRMSDACKSKCITTTYDEGDLKKGECICLDRCVSKYLQVHEILGQSISAMTQAEAMQQRRSANQDLKI